MEQIGSKGAVLFINDSKATNADSAAKALASFEAIYWIAGGKPKDGGITSLAEFFPRIAKAYLIGEAAQGVRRYARRPGRPMRSSEHSTPRSRNAARDAAGERQAVGGAAVSGLRLVRPVPEFRGAGRATFRELVDAAARLTLKALIKPKPQSGEEVAGT